MRRQGRASSLITHHGGTYMDKTNLKVCAVRASRTLCVRHRRPLSPRTTQVRRVRAHKLRRWRWRCVTGAADRWRRDRWLCPCPLRAGELCAVRGKAPLVICSGSASRRGLPYGDSTRCYGGANIRAMRMRNGVGAGPGRRADRLA
jgi:hypothetical protein